MASADLFEPQSWNRYSYVINNPLNYVDPLGLAYNMGGGTAEMNSQDPKKTPSVEDVIAADIDPKDVIVINTNRDKDTGRPLSEGEVEARKSINSLRPISGDIVIQDPRGTDDKLDASQSAPPTTRFGKIYDYLFGMGAVFRAARADKFWHDAFNPCNGPGQPRCQIGIIYVGGSLKFSASKLAQTQQLTFAQRVLNHSDGGPFHNLPTLVVNEVLNAGKVTVKSGSYVEYTMPGAVNGTSGVYEIGVNPQTSEIVHRFFRPN